MLILNLYAGVGGNRKFWDGHKVIAVENDPKIAAVYEKLYPEDDVFIDDAHQFLLDTYDQVDFIWSSPPCQTHSTMARANPRGRKKYPDMALYEEILFLQQYAKCPWVVENVKPFYTPLIEPTAIVGRHCFWASFHIDAKEVKSLPGFIKMGTVAGKEAIMDWLGIHFEEKLYYRGNHDPSQVVRNCVHPNLGRDVLNSYLNSETSKK